MVADNPKLKIPNHPPDYNKTRDLLNKTVSNALYFVHNNSGRVDMQTPDNQYHVKAYDMKNGIVRIDVKYIGG